MTPEKMAKLHSNSEANHRTWDAHEFAEILSSKGVLAECHEHGFALARVIESEDEFGFEIVDAILGGVYNRYQGHRNTENKPIIKWHCYSSYPINYQKVWLNKLAIGEQLDP